MDPQLVLLTVFVGKGFGRVWKVCERILKDLEASQQVLSRSWTCLGIFGPAGAKFLIGTPTLIRSASQDAGIVPPAWLNRSLRELKY